VDDNGNITYTKVVEAEGLKAEEIYTRALNYFTYNYGSGKAVIQTQDKEQGLIVGKGIYAKVHVGASIVTTVVDSWHILRVDVKEGKARILVTLTDYELTIISSGTYGGKSLNTVPVSSSYPFNEKGGSKTVMSKAFYKTHQRALKTLDAVEKAIKEGNTSKSIEEDKW
jgi:hypothetical protein